METKKYRTSVLSDQDYPDIPNKAVFEIERGTAEEIVRLSVLVKENGLYSVEKFDYRVTWLSGGKKSDVMDSPCLEVSERDFRFTALLKGSSTEIWTEEMRVKDLAEHFKIPLVPEKAPAKVVIGVDAGVVSEVTSDTPLQYVVYEYDTEGGEPVEMPSLFEGHVVEVIQPSVMNADTRAQKVAEIFLAVRQSEQPSEGGN